MTEEEFWARVYVKEDDKCWEWRYGKYDSGYGRIGWKGHAASAHRVVWELTNGPIPPGLCVCHTCDNPPCCNPFHLFLGTNKDNVQDAISKGRMLNEEQRHKISEAQKGKHHSEESKRKMSEMHKNMSEETRRKMSEARKGCIPWNVGKHPSEEAKGKMSEAQKRRRVRERSARSAEYDMW